MAPIIGLLLFFIVAIGFIAWFVNSIWKNRKDFLQTWKNVPEYERKALISGLALFLFIPLLKGHPAHELYIPAVLIELIYSAAGALFVLGVLSFLKEGHALRSKNK